MPSSALSEQQRATIADRARVWEVRRFCQVLPSVVKYVRGSEAGLTSTPSERHGRCIKIEPDGALAALLRCIIHQTGADLAMVSLLDDHTQYFISGASRANADDAKVSLGEYIQHHAGTAPAESLTYTEDSTRWYGCESVTHHGGLCERTITRRNEPGNMAIYEELDMAKLERTKDLPFVKGDIARFRHYAGVPLNPYGGPNIGTVFTFSSTPSKDGLSEIHRSYLFDTASHIIRHLERAVEALEGKRVHKFNQSVASLLRMGSSAELAAESKHDQSSSQNHNQRQSLVSNLYNGPALRLYHLFATLLYEAFEFDGVRIQESEPSGNFTNRNPAWNGSSILAEHLGPRARRPHDLSHTLTSRLLQLFPHGAVFQILDETDEIIAATSASDIALVDDPIISAELSTSFPKAAQIVLMPLWDTFHERNTGAVLGFANTQSRVYLGSTDLVSIFAFCTTIMTQVRRLEAQAMEKIKSDFLGSVSHEMRTPLHGMLSSLELLADIPHNAHQHDLLEMARYSGLSLLDTIERILYFSNISSGSQNSDQTRSDGSTEGLVHPSNLVQHQATVSPVESDTVDIISICEDIIHSESQRLRLKEAVQSEPSIGQYTGSL
jgi:signal transduction histidine kinase